MNEENLPLVSIIIPHWKGEEILLRCLKSVLAASYRPVEVLLVDNGSADGSIQRVAEEFGEVSIIRSEINLGYAGGCNLGLRKAVGRYALLLNDDAVVEESFLGPLVRAMEADSSVAGCQPKILSISEPHRFDYAGAAGGFVDFFGFPFCRGRILEEIEEDSGQYDAEIEIGWASGACLLLRRETLERSGILDESFFAHMEEIDLQWRFTNLGFRILFVPSSVIRHDAGSTLAQNQPFKVYLNHRNSLIMILKNHRPTDLLIAVPIRLLLEIGAFMYRLLRLEFRSSLAIIRAFFAVLWTLPATASKRNLVSPTHRNPMLYPRSIVIDYFVRRRRTFSSLQWTPGKRND